MKNYYYKDGYLIPSAKKSYNDNIEQYFQHISLASPGDVKYGFGDLKKAQERFKQAKIDYPEIFKDFVY